METDPQESSLASTRLVTYDYAHQYSNERSTYICDVNNDDWYNQYHYPQQKLEGYWPSYNYEADLQSSSQLESSQYEGYETNTEDSLICLEIL